MAKRNTKSDSKIEFYQIIDGSFRTPAEADDPAAIERVNKNDKTVYELSYNELEGYVRDIQVDEEENQFGQQNMRLFLHDPIEKETMVISVAHHSGEAMAILSRIPNIDLSKPLTVGVFVPKDSKRRTLYFKQDSESISRYYSKDEPNGMPPFRSEKDGKKTIWFVGQTFDFLYEKADEALSAHKEANQSAGEPEEEGSPFDLDDAEPSESSEATENRRETSTVSQEDSGISDDDIPF